MDIFRLVEILVLANTVEVIICIVIVAKTNARNKTVKEAVKDAGEITSENQVNYLQKELNNIKSGYALTQKELQNLKQINSDLSGKLSKQKEVHDSNNKEFDRLKAESFGNRNKVSEKENELEKLRAKHAAIESELKNKTEELLVLKKENTKVKDLTAQAEKLKKENEALHSAVHEFTNKDKELLQTSKEREIELQRLTVENLGIKDQLLGEEGKLEELRAKHAAIESELKSKAEELLVLKKENTKVKDLTAQVEKFRKENESLHSAVNEFKNKDKESLHASEGKEIELGRLRAENSGIRNKLSEKEGELEKLLTKHAAIEGELKSKAEELRVFKEENTKVKELTAQVEKLKKENESLYTAVTQSRNEDKELLRISKEPEAEPVDDSEANRLQKSKRIGEVLLENNFVTKEIIAKAVEYQEQFGGSITQYLISNGYIDEFQLAQCICHQFGVPYLPLSSYDIPEEIIKLVPIDIAEKHWLIPVQKTGISLAVIMADPFDVKAIKTVEKITGCKVQPFVGILSDIIQALESYYKVVINDGEQKTKKPLPIFITSQAYKGIERREWTRFNVKVEVCFPFQDSYKKTITKDISRGGFSFESDVPLEIGSIVPLQINLPKESSFFPILAVVQVLRIKSLENGKFDIGSKTIKIAKEEISALIKYAFSHKEG